MVLYRVLCHSKLQVQIFQVLTVMNVVLERIDYTYRKRLYIKGWVCHFYLQLLGCQSSNQTSTGTSLLITYSRRHVIRCWVHVFLRYFMFLLRMKLHFAFILFINLLLLDLVCFIFPSHLVQGKTHT